MKTTTRLASLAAGALALLATGCDDGFTEAALTAMKNNAAQKTVAVEGITLDPESYTLESGSTFTLTAEITPKNASDKKVDWSSSNESVATVDEDGTVTAKQVNWTRTVWITATTRDGGFTATCWVTVKEKVIAVEEVRLNKTALTLTLRDTERLTATVLPDDADNKTVRWSSSDSDVASVDYYDGTVTARKRGTATITAKAGDMKAECVVTVSVPEAEGFEIDDYGRLTKYTGSDTAVTIPDGVSEIEPYAFEGCTSLTEVTIPDSVTEIGWGAFVGCTSLESVEIPDSVTEIGSSAFEGCTSLTSVTIPDGVTSIGERAFYECTSLTEVTIPDSVTSIGDEAFEGCSLKKIEFGGTVAQWKAIAGSDNVTVTFIQCSSGHIGVKDVPAYLKMSGTTVTDYTDSEEFPPNLVIPDGVTEIGSYAFHGCTDLTSVTIPDGVTSIGERAFYECTSLTEVTIPSSVTSIGFNVFNECTNLEKVTYQGTLAEWCAMDNDWALMYYAKAVTVDGTDLKSLTTLVIPNGVTEIEGGAFYKCENLTSVTIPDGVTSIKDGAFFFGRGRPGTFEGCTGLTEVTIPGSVTNIGGRAFYGCSSLTTITYKGTTAQWTAIEKECGTFQWDYSTGEYTVNCTDGTVSKDGTVTN